MCCPGRGLDQLSSLRWAKKEHFLICPSLILHNFCPQFGPPGWWLSHLRRSWVHHWFQRGYLCQSYVIYIPLQSNGNVCHVMVFYGVLLIWLHYWLSCWIVMKKLKFMCKSNTVAQITITKLQCASGIMHIAKNVKDFILKVDQIGPCRVSFAWFKNL